eukprot:COSAG06_NODE_33499_length_489_cov_0.564103_2_plen_47_part_01
MEDAQGSPDPEGEPVRRNFIPDEAAINHAVERIMEHQAQRLKVYVIL